MFARRHLLAGFLAVFALLLLATPAVAADWDSIPELESRRHVAIKKRFDGPRYDDLRTCYRRFDSRVDAEYFAVLVDVTAEDGSRSRKRTDADPYAAHVFKTWGEQKRLDKDDAIVAVLGVRNRSFGLHVGEKWKKLGFTGEVVDETLAASNFPKLRRRRKYVEAMCSLVTVVDLRLANLEREMKQRISALKERLPGLDEKLTALDERVSQRFDGEHPFGAKLSARLATARSDLEKANEIVEKEPAEAVLLADQVEAAFAPVQADLQTYNADITRLQAFEKDLAQLRRQIEERPDLDWEHPQAALAKLDECEEMAATIRNTYEGRPEDVRDCQRSAEKELAQADVHYFYRKKVAPPIGTAAVVLLLVGLVTFRLRRRSRALRLLRPDLARWEGEVEEMSSRLDALQKDCPHFFDERRNRWQGESHVLDHHASKAVERVAVLSAEAHKVFERAKKLDERSHLLDIRRAEKALCLLREATVADTEASRAFEQFEQAFAQASARLADFRQVREQLDERSSKADEAMVAAARAVEERRELGLPADHLAKPLEAALDAWNQATGLAADDPVRALQIFEEVVPRFEELAEQAAQGNELVRDVQGPLTALADDIEQRIRRLRLLRIDFAKLSFDPPEELEMANARAVDVLKLVAQACEAEAKDAYGALEADLVRLGERVDAVDAAREGIPKRLEALEERREELKSRLLKTRYVLRLLLSDTDSEELHFDAQKLGQYHARLNRISKVFTRPAELHAEGHYLLASERVAAVDRLCDDAEALLDKLANLDERFEEARGQATELVETCEPLLRELQRRVLQDGVSPTLGTLVAEQAVSFQMLHDEVRAGHANWLAAAEELLCLHKVLTFLSTEIDADLAGTHRDGQSAATRREYRIAQVENMSYHPTRSDLLSAASLGSASSWADSVATLDDEEEEAIEPV